jgi:hypothetical protein
MKKYVEVINTDEALKSMIPLNVFLGDVSERDRSYETDSLTYIYSSRYQTNLLFIQLHYKHVSRLLPKKYKSNDHETGA